MGHFAWPGTFKVKVRQLETFFISFIERPTDKKGKDKRNYLIFDTWKRPESLQRTFLAPQSGSYSIDGPLTLTLILCFDGEISILCIFVQTKYPYCVFIVLIYLGDFFAFLCKRISLLCSCSLPQQLAVWKQKCSQSIEQYWNKTVIAWAEPRFWCFLIF